MNWTKISWVILGFAAAVSSIVLYFTQGIIPASQVIISSLVLYFGIKVISKRYGNNAFIPLVLYVAIISLSGNAIANGTEKMMEFAPYIIFVIGVFLLSAALTQLYYYTIKNND